MKVLYEAQQDIAVSDPADAARYHSLAVLLGRLRSEDERGRFAALYRREARDADAEASLREFLGATAALWSREEVPGPAHQESAPRELVGVA